LLSEATGLCIVDAPVLDPDYFGLLLPPHFGTVYLSQWRNLTRSLPETDQRSGGYSFMKTLPIAVLPLIFAMSVPATAYR